MAAKKSSDENTAKTQAKTPTPQTSAVATSARSTVSGPAAGPAATQATEDAPTDRYLGVDALVASLPHNPSKADEYGEAAATPQPGAHAKVSDVRLTASTLTENVASNKVGAGRPNLGLNTANLP